MGTCYSNMLSAGERTSLCCASTALVYCLVFTIIGVLALGIGLGYNHCFVDMKTRYKYVPAHYVYPDSPRWSFMHKQPEQKYLRTLDDDITKLSKVVDQLENTDPTFSLMSDTTENGTILPESNNTMRDDAAKEFLNSSEDDLNTLKLLETISHSREQEQNDNKTLVIPITGLKLLDLLSKIKDSNYSLQINYI